eukprot:2528253-Lingulodinium_polyedra.AAC.1
MASSSTSAQFQELSHEGMLEVKGSAPTQWLVHSGTGEKSWLPPGPEWQLALGQSGHGYIYRTVEGEQITRWVSSGPQPLLKKSMHSDGKRQFILDKVTGIREWVDDIKKAFS